MCSNIKSEGGKRQTLRQRERERERGECGRQCCPLLLGKSREKAETAFLPKNDHHNTKLSGNQVNPVYLSMYREI